MENILNGAGLNEAADNDLAVLMSMGENADRETQNKFTGLLWNHQELQNIQKI